MNIFIIYENIKDIQDSRLTSLNDILLKVTENYSVSIKYTELNFNIIKEFYSLSTSLSYSHFTALEPPCSYFYEILDKIIASDIFIVIPSLNSSSHDNLINFFNCASYACMPHKSLHKKLNHITGLIFSSDSFKITNFLAHSLTFMGVKNLLHYKISSHMSKNDSLNKINICSFYKKLSLCFNDTSSNFTVLKFYLNSLSIKYIFMKNYFSTFKILYHLNKS